MAIPDEFLELMPDTVKWEKFGARGRRAGTEEFGRPKKLRARVVMLKVDRRAAADEVAERPTAWIFGAPGIDPHDRITLPDGSQPPILAVQRYTDEEGAHHEKVSFGLEVGSA